MSQIRYDLQFVDCNVQCIMNWYYEEPMKTTLIFILYLRDILELISSNISLPPASLLVHYDIGCICTSIDFY